MSYESEVLARSPGAFARLDEDGSTIHSSGVHSGKRKLVDSSGADRYGFHDSSVTLGVADSPMLSDPASRNASYASAISQFEHDAAFNAASFSVVLWVKSSTTGVFQMLLTRDSNLSGNTRMWQFRLSSAANAVAQFVKIAGGTVTVSGATTVNDGDWHMVTLSLDATTSQARIWVDTNLDVTQTCTGLPTTGTCPLIFAGRYSSGYTQRLGGSLDEVAYFPGVVLTQSDVDDIYDAAFAAPAPIGGEFTGVLSPPVSALGGSSEQPPVEGQFVGVLSTPVSTLTNAAPVTGALGSTLAPPVSALAGLVDFAAFEPPTVGAGFPLRFSARLSPPLSVDVDDVVPFRKVASSVSEG